MSRRVWAASCFRDRDFYDCIYFFHAVWVFILFNILVHNTYFHWKFQCLIPDLNQSHRDVESTSSSSSSSPPPDSVCAFDALLRYGEKYTRHLRQQWLLTPSLPPSRATTIYRLWLWYKTINAIHSIPEFAVVATFPLLGGSVTETDASATPHSIYLYTLGDRNI